MTKGIDKDIKSQEKANSSSNNNENIVSPGPVSDDEFLDLLKEQEMVDDEIAQSINELDQMQENEFLFDIFNEDTFDSQHPLSIVTASVGQDNDDNNQVKLIVADILNENFPSVQALKVMAKELSKRSKGRISMKVFSDGVFGTEEEALQQTADGTLDMARVNIFQFHDLYPEAVVPTLPFVFDSISHMHKSLDNEPGKIILDAISSKDYVGLSLFDSSARNMYAKKPIRNIHDMKGLNFRILPSLYFKDIIESMEAKSTILPLDVVEIELHEGTINAAENNIFSYQGFEHYRECKYYSLTEHVIAPDVLVFSKNRWEKLSAEDKKIIIDSATVSGLASRDFCLEAEKLARHKIELEGATIVDDIDKSSFKESLKGVYKNYVVTPQQIELLEKIKAVK